MAYTRDHRSEASASIHAARQIGDRHPSAASSQEARREIEFNGERLVSTATEQPTRGVWVVGVLAG